MLRIWFIILIIFACDVCGAQSFYSKRYRASDGLNTDMIKAVAEDQHGFIWIGSDNGLIRYDGNSFITYPKATSSTYIKDFLTRQDGALWAVHDLGIVEIRNKLDTVIFKPVLKGSRKKTDSTIWYPKQAYEDNKGNIWIAEPQSIVKWTDGRWERFAFGAKENSLSFVESFNFFQLNQDSLIVSSYPGNLFLYRYSSNKLTPVKPGLSTHIYRIKRINGDVLLGCTNGLYKLNECTLQTKRILSDGIYSDFMAFDSNTFITCSETNKNFLVTRKDGHYTREVIEESPGKTNSIFKSSGGTYWLGTERGLLLLNPLGIQRIEHPEMYVEAIIDGGNHIYTLTKENIFSIDNNNEVSLVANDPNSYFLTGDVLNGSLWVSNGFQIWQIRDGEILQKTDMTSYGRYVFDLHKDANDFFWIAQETSKGLKRMNPENGDIVQYDADKGLPVEITAIQSTAKGVYAASAQPNQYLSYKPYHSAQFKNLSAKLPEDYLDGFYINDIAVEETGEIWLGTNFGLFKQEEDTIRKITFNSEFDNTSISSVRLNGDFLWFGNTFGLFRYHLRKGTYSVFNENTGSPMNAVSEEGILLQGDKIWIGTSAGIAVLNDSWEHKKTRKPLLLNFKVNNNPVNIFDADGVAPLPHMAFVEVIFSALSFPTENVKYSYRLKGIQDDWSIPSADNRAQFSELPEGEYSLEIKAKMIGSYQWSDVYSFRFEVSPPFYKTWPFYLSIIVLALLIVAITRFVMVYLHEKRRRVLERLVEERTHELNQYKENLEKLVDERTSALQNTLSKLKSAQYNLVQSEKMASLGLLSAGVAHEINNPLNFIRGGITQIEKNLSDKSEAWKYVEIMDQGVERISKIVNSLSHFSHQGDRMDDDCRLDLIIENCLMILQNKLKYKVDINRDFEDNLPVIKGNEGKLHQVFVNLLSNAEQAIEKQGKISITIKALHDEVVVSIADTGVGIAHEDFHKLRDPFYTTKAPGEGTGLGLYISYDIIENHGGRIEFTSEVGKGTTFDIIMPVQ